MLQTYIGQVLVSVNPYKNLPIYDQATIGEYQNTHFYEVPPHMWVINIHYLSTPVSVLFIKAVVFNLLWSCIPSCTSALFATLIQNNMIFILFLTEYIQLYVQLIQYPHLL